MIEYIYDAIRATAGQEICICALITDDEGNAVSEGCGLMLHDDDGMIVKVEGVFNGEDWSFVIPAEATQGLKGRYWYCICRANSNLCFKTPIYLK
jgi:hypothetical protein